MAQAKMKARLSIISKAEIRPDDIEGEIEKLPEEGKPFIMLGKPKREGMAQTWIETLPVIHVEPLDLGTYEFVTGKGKYRISVW